MLLVHSTNPKNIKAILKNGALQSFNKTRNPGEGEGLTTMDGDLVYLSVLFQFYKILLPEITESNVYLFFDAKTTIETSNALHFCPEWDWGKFIKDDCQYIKNTDIDTQLTEFDKLYKKRWNKEKNPQRYVFGLPSADFAINEILFKDEVKLELNLVGIYCYNATWQHPLLMTKFSQVQSFLNDFGYTDIGTHTWPINLPHDESFIQYKKYYNLYNANKDDDISGGKRMNKIKKARKTFKKRLTKKENNRFDKLNAINPKDLTPNEKYDFYLLLGRKYLGKATRKTKKYTRSQRRFYKIQGDLAIKKANNLKTAIAFEDAP